MKKFEDVEIGDVTFSCDDNMYAGHVLAKGSFKELSKKYSTNWSVEDLEEFGIDTDEEGCVAITQNPNNTMEGFTDYIFFYGEEPCFVYCKE